MHLQVSHPSNNETRDLKPAVRLSVKVFDDLLKLAYSHTTSAMSLLPHAGSHLLFRAFTSKALIRGSYVSIQTRKASVAVRGA